MVLCGGHRRVASARVVPCRVSGPPGWSTALGGRLTRAERAEQGVDTRGVTGVLDRVVEAHEGMPPDAFNDDVLYKRNLNQARRGPPPGRIDLNPCAP